MVYVNWDVNLPMTSKNKGCARNGILGTIYCAESIVLIVSHPTNVAITNFKLEQSNHLAISH